MKAYPAYKDSGIEWIGEIPAGWQVTKLKRMTIFNYGNSLPNNLRENGNVPVYGSNGIVGNHKESICEAPCIIIGRKGSFGKINFSEVQCFAIDTTYFIDRSATSNIIKWLFYLLHTLNLDAISKDSAVPGLSREDAYEKYCLLPSIYEQQAIANYLDRQTQKLDRLIALKEKKIELLKEYRAALINQAVTKGLNPHVKMKDSGIEWLGQIPEHWEVKKIKSLVTKIGSGITPNGGSQVYQDNGIPFLRSQNIYFNKLKLDDVVYISEAIHNSMSRSKVQLHDVLLNITGASIGRCCVIKKEFGEMNVNQHVCIIRPKQKILSSMLCYFLSSETGQEQIFRIQNGTSREGLNYEQIGNFDIPLPHIEEQLLIINLIDEHLTKSDNLLENAHSQIAKLKEYRAALISAAVTGKIDVREALENPSSQAGKPESPQVASSFRSGLVNDSPARKSLRKWANRLD